MNNTIYHLTVPTASVNTQALTAALRPYQALEYFPGSWFVRGAQNPKELVAKIREAIGHADPVIIPVDAGNLDQMYLSEKVRGFLGVSRAA